MKCFLLVFFLNFLQVFSRGINGGMSCAVCTVLSGVVMQVAEIHEDNFFNATKRLCNYLPNIVRKSCLETISKIEPYFINVSDKLTPDLFCLIYGTCTVSENQKICHLFPLPHNQDFTPKILEHKINAPKIDVCTLPVIQDICSILNNSYHTLSPAEDLDNDGFGYLRTARGSDWKGRDCLDSNPEVYPGRRPLSSDYNLDSNCNGIFGIQPNTNKSWEKILCSQSKPRGLIYIGDSIGAHFHMPEVWINPLLFDWPGLNASDVILDEVDWPQFGFATGYRNISNTILINGFTDSLYWRLRSRNRCNHRDYQNLSQNGASSLQGVEHAEALTRNSSTDNPAIVIYAMQGNDVCNNFNETESHMTKPRVFRKHVLRTLLVLDEKLPVNSHVVLMGLVNADFIYSAMAEKLHPIGKLHKNVYYKDMYNWFNCMQIGPCYGWLNPNETLRNVTTLKAEELTAVLRQIVQTKKFQKFKLHFIENPINIIMKKEKIHIPDLLEAVDSLHPNQKAQPILADIVWDSLTKLPKEVLGPKNPYNKLIKSLFGNQGGH